jgi:hypothetical protein
MVVDGTLNGGHDGSNDGSTDAMASTSTFNIVDSASATAVNANVNVNGIDTEMDVEMESTSRADANANVDADADADASANASADASADAHVVEPVERPQAKPKSPEETAFPIHHPFHCQPWNTVEEMLQVNPRSPIHLPSIDDADRPAISVDEMARDLLIISNSICFADNFCAVRFVMPKDLAAAIGPFLEFPSINDLQRQARINAIQHAESANQPAPSLIIDPFVPSELFYGSFDGKRDDHLRSAIIQLPAAPMLVRTPFLIAALSAPDTLYDPEMYYRFVPSVTSPHTLLMQYNKMMPLLGIDATAIHPIIIEKFGRLQDAITSYLQIHQSNLEDYKAAIKAHPFPDKKKLGDEQFKIELTAFVEAIMQPMKVLQENFKIIMQMWCKFTYAALIVVERFFMEKIGISRHLWRLYQTSPLPPVWKNNPHATLELTHLGIIFEQCMMAMHPFIIPVEGPIDADDLSKGTQNTYHLLNQEFKALYDIFGPEFVTIYVATAEEQFIDRSRPFAYLDSLSNFNSTF